MPLPRLDENGDPTEPMKFSYIRDEFNSYSPHRLSDYYSADQPGWTDPDAPEIDAWQFNPGTGLNTAGQVFYYVGSNSGSKLWTWTVP